VPAEAVYDTPCDVYAPCAVGATLNVETIPRLACRIVAGSANNQLAEDADAERLHARGILYAPDYVVNAGGATAFATLARGVSSDAELLSRVERLEEITRAILEEAGDEVSPLVAARRRVERRLRAAAEAR
jgi:leucine dehydrogenase